MFSADRKRGVDPTDGTRAQRLAALADRDRSVEPVQVVCAQLEETDVSEVRDQVEVQGVTVERHRLGLERVFPRQPDLEVLADPHA